MKKSKHPLLKIDKDRHEVFVYGERKHLPLKQYQILILLWENNKLLTRQEIISEIWNGDKDVDTRTVDQHIARLRASVGFKIVEGVAGCGYRIAAL